MNNTLQLTIRGLNTQTKEALVNQAKQQGVSLNRYTLQILKHSAGHSSTTDRYRELKKFLDEHRIDQADAQTVEETLAWADRTSIGKQRREKL